MRIYHVAYFDKLLLRSSIQTANEIQCNAHSLEQTRAVYKDSKTF
jgi:hypothetical protein